MGYVGQHRAGDAAGAAGQGQHSFLANFRLTGPTGGAHRLFGRTREPMPYGRARTAAKHRPGARANVQERPGTHRSGPVRKLWWREA